MELTCSDDIKVAAKEIWNKLLANEKFNDCFAVREFSIYIIFFLEKFNIFLQMKLFILISSFCYFQNLKKEAILEACISDYCYCKDEHRKECACNGLTVFAKECLFQGINLKNDWRNMELCRKFIHIFTHLHS